MVISIIIERNIISDALSAVTDKHFLEIGYMPFKLFNFVFTSVIDSYLSRLL